MASKGFTSFVIKEMQIKATRRYSSQLLEWLKSERLAIPNVGKSIEKLGCSYNTDVSKKRYNNLEELFGSFLKFTFFKVYRDNIG